MYGYIYQFLPLITYYYNSFVRILFVAEPGYLRRGLNYKQICKNHKMKNKTGQKEKG